MSDKQNKRFLGGFTIFYREDKVLFSLQSNKLPSDPSCTEENDDSELFRMIKEAFSNSIHRKIHRIIVYDPPKKYGKIIEDACVVVEDIGDQDSDIPLQFHAVSISEKNTYHLRTDYFCDDDIKFVLGHNTQNSNSSFLPPIIGHRSERTLAPGHQLGTAKLTISGMSDGIIKEQFSFNFDVRPVKISWLSAQKMLDMVYKKHYELLFENPHKSSTGLRQSFGSDIPKNKYQQLGLLEHIISKNRQYSFGNLIYQIAGNPHKRLVTENRLVPVCEAESPDFEMIPELFQQSLAWKKGKPPIPIQMYDSVARIDYNTPPNRFIKYVAFYFSQELLRLTKAFESDNPKARKVFKDDLSDVDHNYWVQKAKILRNKILPVLNSPFFQEVELPNDLSLGNNQVLLKDPRYRKITENYIKYIRKLEFSNKMEEWFANPLKWMPEIYENYCFFELDDILQKLGNYNQSKIKLKNITVEKLPHNILSSEYKFDKYNIELVYNYTASPKGHYDSYSLGLRPDLSIQVSEGRNHISNVIFDAKYRVDIQDTLGEVKDRPAENAERETKEAYEMELEKRDRDEKRGKYLTGDIYKMHTYREALSKNSKKPDWVIDLYPGSVAKLWDDKRHGGVGAVNLKPEDLNNLQGFIKKYMDHIESPRPTALTQYINSQCKDPFPAS
jgi:predicted component of viral defense system (DUF524 family)